MNSRNLRTTLEAAHRYLAAGKIEEAESLCRQILGQKPNEADALHLLGRVALVTARNTDALEPLRQAASIKRSSAEIRYDLGEAASRCGEFDEAVTAFQKALELQPSMLKAAAGLGDALIRQGKRREGVATLEAVLARDPNQVAALDTLGGLYSLDGRYSDAITYLERAARASPNDPTLHNNLAIALEWQGRLDEAAAEFRVALRLRPTWAKAHSNLLFLLTNSLDNPAVLFAEHQRFDMIHAVRLASEVRPHLNDRRPGRRLNIGYLSADLCDHAVATFLEPVLAEHDRSAVELFAYNDGERTDAVTQRLRSYFQHWREVQRIGNRALVEMIREDAIDILIDLAAHSNAGKRMLLLARKPAPVQVTYLGYAGTTGLSTVDWRLTDPFIDPPGLTDAFNSERLARLPCTQWTYAPPQLSPDVNQLPALGRGHITFASINRLNKISPQVLALWSRVLGAVPTARLSMKARGLEDTGTRERLVSMLAQLGVARERVEFAGYGTVSEYLEFFHNIDVVLDPYPFAGGTSTCHSLWMGVPVITRAGRTPVSRVGVSVLSNVGLPEFIAEDDDAYVATAVHIASDLQALSLTRSGLREKLKQSPLCDARGFVRDLESAYRQMWERWCASSS